MTRCAVCRLDDIADAAMKAVRVNGRDLVLVRHGERVFAVRDVCLHQGARLSNGSLAGTTVSRRVGEYRLERSGQILRCPWHGWEYDASDGGCLNDPARLRVPTYKVEVVNGEVVVIM